MSFEFPSQSKKEALSKKKRRQEEEQEMKKRKEKEEEEMKELKKKIKKLKEKYGPDLEEDPNRLFFKCKTADGKEITHVVSKKLKIPFRENEGKPIDYIPIEEVIAAYSENPDKSFAEGLKLLRESKVANKENGIKEK